MERTKLTKDHKSRVAFCMSSFRMAWVLFTSQRLPISAPTYLQSPSHQDCLEYDLLLISPVDSWHLQQLFNSDYLETGQKCQHCVAESTQTTGRKKKHRGMLNNHFSIFSNWLFQSGSLFQIFTWKIMELGLFVGLFGFFFKWYPVPKISTHHGSSFQPSHSMISLHLFGVTPRQLSRTFSTTYLGSSQHSVRRYDS